MFGKILFINDNVAHVENTFSSNQDAQSDLMNMHVIFEDGAQRVLGEVTEFNQELIKMLIINMLMVF